MTDEEIKQLKEKVDTKTATPEEKLSYVKALGQLLDELNQILPLQS